MELKEVIFPVNTTHSYLHFKDTKTCSLVVYVFEFMFQLWFWNYILHTYQNVYTLGITKLGITHKYSCCNRNKQLISLVAANSELFVIQVIYIPLVSFGDTS